jgi:hypothetical protein
VSGPIRVVVAEGPSNRKGLLRFVLEGEGYDVVSGAETSAELARVVAVHRPDVVVMDEGIGSMAVGMIRQVAPSTRVILVWPGAVVPIGGDARVEPSDVLRELGRTMERLTGQPRITHVGDPLHDAGAGAPSRQDPAMLREILARGDAAQLQRPQLSHAGAATVHGDEGSVGDRAPAAVVILPVTASVDPADEVVVVPEADALEGATNQLDRPLGTVAPVGAAAAGTLILAPDLGAPKVRVRDALDAPSVTDGGGYPGGSGRGAGHADHAATHRHAHKR